MAIYSRPNLTQPVKTGIFKCHSLRPKMPALNNPRYERFAQALFAGLAGETRVKRAQSTAYLTAYPNCSNGNSAEAAASRLLRRVKPILERVRELQAESMARQQHSIDLSRDRVGRDLDLAFRTAKEQGNATAMVSSALGIAKVFHAVPNEQDNPFSFKSATSMHDIGRKLLLTVGMQNPDDRSIEQAIEANNTFVATLESIATSQRTIDAS